jgi:hypothetical protein
MTDGITLFGEVRLTCPFLRRVGAPRPNWCEKFQLKDIL